MKKAIKFLLIFSLLSVLLCIPNVDTTAKVNEVYVVKIEDATINPITADYIIDAIDKAYEDGAECIVIELDTPGGLLASTRLIIKKIMSAEIPVVVYIYPSGSRAGSAGVFITYASHIAAMAPSTNIGAAHPVRMGIGERRQKDVGRDTQEAEQIDVMGEKVLHDAVAFIRSLAKERGRNVRWAEKSVVESASITEKEALRNNVIEIIAESEGDLLNKLDGRKVKIGGRTKVLNTKNAMMKYIDMNFRQRFLNILANPNIAYILLILGFYGLLFEVTHPGIGFPGIAGAICIILAFFSMQTLPTNYAGLALIILGIILFIAEANTPTFGLLTLGGLVSMVLGSLLLFESPEQIMRVSITLIISFALATAGITIVLVRAVIVSHKRKVVSGKEGLIGGVGRARTKISPEKSGKVFIHGEIWDAVSNETIKKGGKIQVVKVDGMTLEVKKS